jgi:hypothetical protein
MNAVPRCKPRLHDSGGRSVPVGNRFVVIPFPVARVRHPRNAGAVISAALDPRP